jgi:glucan-binding YG repeat protein
MDADTKRPGLRRKLAIALAAALIAAPAAAAVAPIAGGIAGTEAHAAEAQAKGQWMQSGSRWWYRNADGSYPSGCWKEIDGLWYHFDASGWMQTGWLMDGGDWYYLLPSGGIAMHSWDIGGKVYLFDEGTGKLLYNKAERYSGLGMIYDDSIVCSDSEGILVPSGWKYVDASDGCPGGWIYLDQSSQDPRYGYMHFFWKRIGGSWYYFMPTWLYGDHRDGFYPRRAFMVTGWQKIDGSWYCFAASGAMIHDCWAGNYYLGSSGAMLTDARTPDGYYVGTDGAWVPGR